MVIRTREVYLILASGIAAIGCAIAILTAILQDKRPFLPVFLLGVLVTAGAMFVTWRIRSNTDASDAGTRAGMSDAIAYALIILGAFVVLAITLIAMLPSYAQAEAHPCLCIQEARGGAWLNLIVMACVLSAMASWSIFALAVAGYRLMHIVRILR